MKSRTFAVLKFMLAGFLLQALSGCDTSDEENPVISTTSTTEITLPNVLRTVSALDTDSLQLTVRVNDVDTELERGDDDIWSGVVQVPRNDQADISVEWSTLYGTTNLKLAEDRQRRFIGNEETSVTFDGPYDTSFNADVDGLTNLVELSQNRSPVNVLDVFIDSNGAFFNGLDLPSSGECGDRIPIEVVTVRPLEDNPDAPEKEFQGWWCARLQSVLVDADGNEVPVNNIEITVNVDDALIVTDSDTSEFFADFQDDSIEIFIDGNNSKLSTYDGQDDFQFRLAPLGDGVVISRLRPPGQVPENMSGKITYFNGGYKLVATIPVAAVGITANSPFGINVEVNDDDDGGNRDYKYSWIGTENVDAAFLNPAAFGTSQIPLE